VTLYYAQTTLITQDANSENYQSNVFALGGIGSLSLTDANTWVGYINQFYDDCYAAGALRGMAKSNHVVKIYEITAGPPNYPVYELNFDLTPLPGAVDMPMEVALCVSYYASAATTIPRARRRGRIYISGWSETSNGAGRPVAGATADLLDAFTDYAVACDALTNLYAGVWSRTNGAVYEIDTAWVDNEWDTQRRRGGQSTSRDEWTKP
jgi:hypothetical protein